MLFVSAIVIVRNKTLNTHHMETITIIGTQALPAPLNTTLEAWE